MNYLQEAARILADKFEEHASVPITYRREGVFEYVDIPATPGSTPVDLEEESGAFLRSASTDFSFKQSYLQGNEPKRNDIIEYRIGNKLLKYIVTSDGTAAHFMPSDSYGYSYRVRAKLTGVRNVCS